MDANPGADNFGEPNNRPDTESAQPGAASAPTSRQVPLVPRVQMMSVSARVEGDRRIVRGRPLKPLSTGVGGRTTLVGVGSC
jgi:hypothetical protein